MNKLERALGTLFPGFLGGNVVQTTGSVAGGPSMGVTADLQKATGEIRVHLVRTPGGDALVTLELMQAHVPGDGPNLACVRLTASEALRLGELLRATAELAAPGVDDAGAATSTDGGAR